MKKKILLVAAAFVCVAITASGTMAYFTSEDTAHNVITSGSVNIEVVEKTRRDDGVLVDFPEEGITGVMPGTDVSKLVSVENTGASEAWIRLWVESSIRDTEGAALPLAIPEAGPVMTYEVGANWIQGEDGYYYYTLPVASGESTELLFDAVAFSPEMGNEYQGCTANIVIAAQAVQSANNGENVWEAQGWPENEEVAQ